MDAKVNLFSKYHEGDSIPCLDKGFVQLVSHMGSDQSIVSAARVSYGADSKGLEADKKLLFYLYKNKHTSPFEMAKVVFIIKMPIFVARQYIRHRMQNVNEVSARYTEVSDDFYIPTRWRRNLGAGQNKQQSAPDDLLILAKDVMIIDLNGTPFATKDITLVLNNYCNAAYLFYKDLLEAGVAKEMARMVLPLNIYTTMRVCWDLKNLLHFITLREDAHAQAEIQEYGRAIKAFLQDLFPWTMEAYETFKFPCVEQPKEIT